MFRPESRASVCMSDSKLSLTCLMSRTREHVDAAIWLGNGILTPIEAKTLGELPRSAAPEGPHNSMYSTTATSTCTEWEESPMHLAYERWRAALWTCVRSTDVLGSLIGIDWLVEDVT